MRKTLIAFLLAMSACLAFSACDSLSGGGDSGNTESSITQSSSQQQATTYKVTFKQSGQTDVVKTVEKGKSLTDIPTPKAKTGYTVVWDKTTFTNITEDIVVNAVATANKYTVTYDANGGTVTPATQEVTYDADTTLATPEKEDYVFTGWTYNGNAVVSGSAWTIASNVTLVASWQDNRPTYTVTFVQGNQQNEVSVKKGESVATEDVPAFVEKTGYSVAWDITDYTNIQADMTVTAEYMANTYTVTYDADGFVIDGTTVQLTYDAVCSGLDMTLTQNGYNFLGWKYGTVTYTNTSIWNVAEEVTLTADWAEKDQVVVTFTNTDGTTVNKTGYKGQTLADIPTPSDKTGYTVDKNNWYLDEDCTQVASFENLQTGMTVYAKTTAKTYTVSYNANGGNAVENTTVTYDADYTLATPTHTESYMQFAGWKDASSNTIVMTGKWTTDSDVELTAQWTDTREVFTISFVQAGQTTKTFNVRDGESFTEIPTPVAKTGYTITWDEEKLALLNNVGSNVEVTANEVAKTYTITLNVNGGSLDETTITVTYGEEYELPTPTHEEYAFANWTYNNENVALKGTWEIDEEDLTITLVATWGRGLWTGIY